MKSIICFSLYTLLFSHFSFSQQLDSNVKLESDTTKLKMVSIQELQKNTSNDSIVISIAQFEELSSLLKSKSGKLELFLPSVIALIVVVISTLGAYKIGKRQIDSQKKSIEDQIRSQEAQAQDQLKITKEQIQESTKTLLKQINSENRQAWVIDTRNTISELITQANLLNIEFQEAIVNTKRQKQIHEKLTYHKNKALLLLDPDKELHKSFLNSLQKLMTTLDIHLFNRGHYDNHPNASYPIFDNARFMEQSENVINAGRKILYNEWSKIQG